MKSKTKKWFKNIIAVIVAISFIVFNLPIPINRSVDVLEIKLNDPDYLSATKVVIEGKYYVNLFSKDTFEGRITVKGYAITEKDTPTLIVMDYPYWQLLAYELDPHSISSLLLTYGRIYPTRFLSNFIIQPRDKVAENRSDAQKALSKNGYDDYVENIFLVPNVTTRDEAIQKIVMIYPTWFESMELNVK